MYFGDFVSIYFTVYFCCFLLPGQLIKIILSQDCPGYSTFYTDKIFTITVDLKRKSIFLVHYILTFHMIAFRPRFLILYIHVISTSNSIGTISLAVGNYCLMHVLKELSQISLFSQHRLIRDNIFSLIRIFLKKLIP